MDKSQYQTVPEVPGEYRKELGMHAHDVQKLQARILLDLLQELAGPLSLRGSYPRQAAR